MLKFIKIKKGDVPAIILLIALLAEFIICAVIDKFSVLVWTLAVFCFLFIPFLIILSDIKRDMKTPFAISHPVLFWFAKVGIVQLSLFAGFLMILECLYPGSEIEFWLGLYGLFSILWFLPSKIILDRVQREKKQYRI